MKCILCESDNNTEVYRIVGNYTIVKCLNDDLLYVNPQPSIDEYKEFYNIDYFAQRNEIQTAQGYRDYLEQKDIYQRNFFRILRKIDKLRPTKGRILDIGSAFGFFVKCAQMEGWEAFGVEFNAEVARWARDKLKVNVFTGTIDSCNFPNAYFDVICFIAVIEHFMNPFEELKEALRILKKDGLICVITGNFNKVIGGRFLKPPEHLYYFSQRTLEKLLMKIGFSIYTQENYFKFFSVQDFLARFFQYIYTFYDQKLLKYIHRYINTTINLLKISKFPILMPAGQMLVIAKIK